MDRENEKVVAEEGWTKPEKKLQQKRGENARAQPNAQKHSGLVCARQRTERKDKGRKRKLRKILFSVMGWTGKPQGGQACLPATFSIMVSKWQPTALKDLALTVLGLASFYFAAAKILFLSLDSWFHQKLNAGCTYAISFGRPSEMRSEGDETVTWEPVP